jgi:DNA/RNA-binding domain of Phe-tRNA-synthetase-like protein
MRRFKNYRGRINHLEGSEGSPMSLRIAKELRTRFPGLTALVAHVEGVNVGPSDERLKDFAEQLFEETRSRYDLESLKDVPVLRAYRDFFWRVGIDPTKVRPAAEALIRRILLGKPIPSINNLVDSYNLASIRTCIALAAFDRDLLEGELLMRAAGRGERFLGIGMQEPKELVGGEVVVADDEKLVAIYPYRDAEHTKVSGSTKNVLLLICGVPGIGWDVLAGAGEVAIDYVTRFCGGKPRREW